MCVPAIPLLCHLPCSDYSRIQDGAQDMACLQDSCSSTSSGLSPRKPEPWGGEDDASSCETVASFKENAFFDSDGSNRLIGWEDLSGWQSCLSTDALPGCLDRHGRAFDCIDSPTCPCPSSPCSPRAILTPPHDKFTGHLPPSLLERSLIDLFAPSVIDTGDLAMLAERHCAADVFGDDLPINGMASPYDNGHLPGITSSPCSLAGSGSEISATCTVQDSSSPSHVSSCCTFTTSCSSGIDSSRSLSSDWESPNTSVGSFSSSHMDVVTGKEATNDIVLPNLRDTLELNCMPPMSSLASSDVMCAQEASVVMANKPPKSFVGTVKANGGSAEDVANHTQSLLSTELTEMYEGAAKGPILSLDWFCCWRNCVAAFSSQSQLVRHVEAEHLCQKNLRSKEHVCLWEGCPMYGKAVANRCKLRIHVRNHTGERPFKCASCGKAFAQRPALKVHEFTHSGEKPYPCLEANCHRVFANASDRNKHQRTHYNMRPYVCKIPSCGKRYTDPSSLRKHARKKGHRQSDILTACAISMITMMTVDEGVESC